MSTPGNERRINLLDVDWAYDGMSSDYKKTYFLRNKTVAVKIGGTATVQLYGRVGNTRTQIGTDMTSDSLIKVDMMLEDIKAVVSSYTDGQIKVDILGE